MRPDQIGQRRRAGSQARTGEAPLAVPAASPVSWKINIQPGVLGKMLFEAELNLSERQLYGRLRDIDKSEGC